jgi:hypothetical protein
MFISVLKTMKRIETPLQASILLDAFCCPVTLTGNHALQVPSYPVLWETISCLAQTATLSNAFLSQQSFPDVINWSKPLVAVSISDHLNTLN